MDFVSAHGGAIPVEAMGLEGQFTHPWWFAPSWRSLRLPRARQGSVAQRGHGIQDTQALGKAARRAAREFGFTRMWSIHPDQIRPILEAFAPSAHEIEVASKMTLQAAAAHWAPISFEGKLQDRASYRYYWQVLERAHRTGRSLPAEVRGWFDAAPQS